MPKSSWKVAFVVSRPDGLAPMAKPTDPPSSPSQDMPPRPSTEPNATQIWTLKIILLQSPLWILAVAAVMHTGVLRHWNDTTYLLFSVSAAAPSFLLPAFLPSRPDRARPWYQTYYAKLHAWVAILGAFGTYFGTHYFFDLMGMRYAFTGARWTFDAVVVGKSGQQVPVFMYPLTHAYFMTYFAALMAAESAVVERMRLGFVGRAVVVFGLSYAVAFAETFFMASPLLSDMFAYRNRERMLKVGSLGYGLYFVVGLPMVRRVDDNGESWTLGRVIIEALAASMMILVLLEAWARLVGSL